MNKILLIFSEKRKASGRKLVRYDAHTPDINFLSIPNLKALRGTIKEGSSESPHIKFLSLNFFNPTNIQINDLDSSFITIVKNVLRLKVPVTDPLLMEVHQNINYLLRNRQNFFWTERFSIDWFPRKLIPQIWEFAVFHNNVSGSLFLIKIVVMIADYAFVIEWFYHPIKIF